MNFGFVVTWYKIISLRKNVNGENSYNDVDEDQNNMDNNISLWKSIM